MNLPLVLSIITVVVNLVLGSIVLHKNKNGATHRTIFALTLVLSLWSITNYFSFHGRTPHETLMWIRIVMAITGVMFSTIYLLSVNYPYGKLMIPKKNLGLVIIETLFIVILSTSPFLFTQVLTTPTISPIPGPGMPLYAAHVLVYLALSTFILIRKQKKVNGNAKNQMKYLVLGIITTFSLATLTSFLAVILFQTSNMVAYGPAYSLILIGFISYAISKHRLLDINFLVFRAATFTAVTIIITAVYALSIFGFTKLLPQETQLPVSVLLALILVYTYNPLHYIISIFTKKIFFRQPYSSETLLERLGELLRSTLSLHTLLKGVVSELQITIRPVLAFFVISTDDNLKKTGYGDTPTLTEEQLFKLKKYTEDKSLLIFNEIDEGEEKELLRELNTSVVIPLQVKEQHHGCLLLGDKSSGDNYTRQDIDVLEMLSPQLSIAIQNAKSYEEISQFNKTLKNEINKATADLKKANQHLKHLDKLKDEFVFVATHELKNPVTIMRGYLSMLKEGIYGKIPDNMAEPLDQMQTSNQQLVDLVNDLLQIARSEAKTVTIKTEPTNLVSIVDAVTEATTPSAQQKGLKLVYQRPDNLPQIKADSKRVTEILNNLISNAIKYSEKGTIEISHEQKGDSILTNVKDQGFGISKQDQAKLFTRFYRVEDEAAKGIPGTGLGLFIVKQLLEKMGGSISLESEKGSGSTFTFSLPIV